MDERRRVENDAVGRRKRLQTLTSSAPPSQEPRVTATVCAWVEESLDRGPDPPERRAERIRTARRSVVRYVALQFDEPVLDVDCRRDR
jgi:hypothetical protein